MDKIDTFLKIPNMIEDFLDASKAYKKFANYLNDKNLSNFKVYKDATELFFTLFNLKLSTSFIYIPYLIVLPLHTYTEKFLTDSTVTNEPADIIGDETGNYTIKAGDSTRTYQRYIDIDGEFYRNQNQIGWDALSLGLPDALNLVWETLAILPNQIPVYYFSNKMGKLIGGSNLFTKLNLGTSKKRAMILLDKIEIGVNSNDDTMIINARIFESYSNQYNNDNTNSNLSDKAVELIDKYLISKNSNYPILSGKYSNNPVSG